MVAADAVTMVVCVSSGSAALSNRAAQRSDRNSAAPVTAVPTTIASSTSAADTAGK
jgi:hypothetical protein